MNGPERCCWLTAGQLVHALNHGCCAAILRCARHSFAVQQVVCFRDLMLPKYCLAVACHPLIYLANSTSGLCHYIDVRFDWCQALGQRPCRGITKSQSARAILDLASTHNPSTYCYFRPTKKSNLNSYQIAMSCQLRERCKREKVTSELSHHVLPSYPTPMVARAGTVPEAAGVSPALPSLTGRSALHSVLRPWARPTTF